MSREWGYVALWRQITRSEVWHKPPVYLKAWVYLLTHANYKTGEVTTTYDRLQDDLSYTERGQEKRPGRQTISAILAWLEEEEMIQKEVVGKGSSRWTKISICNYASYQAKKEGCGTKQKLKQKLSLRSTIEVQENHTSFSPSSELMYKGKSREEREEEKSEDQQHIIDFYAHIDERQKRRGAC